MSLFHLMLYAWVLILIIFIIYDFTSDNKEVVKIYYCKWESEDYYDLFKTACGRDFEGNYNVDFIYCPFCGYKIKYDKP